MTSITHIITGLNVGGAERALYNLITGGLEGPFKNHVISLMGEGHYGPLLQGAGINLTCLDMRMGKPSLTAVQNLRQILRQQAPQIVQGWMYHGNMAAYLGTAGMRSDLKIAWNIRLALDAPEDHKFATRNLIRLSRWVSSKPSAIIYNSERSRTQHIAAGYTATNGHVIANGFNTETWAPDLADRMYVRASLGISSDEVLIGFVGRHHPQKDIQNLLSALNPVLATNPTVHVAFAGRGIARDTPDLGPLISQLPADRIHLLGQRNDIATLVRGFDLLCLPSRTEGFPNVVGEAMAAAIPCIVTDVGDAAQIVGKTGWVVPSRDSKALSEALEQAIGTPARDRQARSLAARERIVQNYSHDSVVMKYRKLYNQIADLN